MLTPTRFQAKPVTQKKAKSGIFFREKIEAIVGNKEPKIGRTNPFQKFDSVNFLKIIYDPTSS